MSDHPGTITYADLSRGTSLEVPIAEVSEASRFVHLRDGLAVLDPGEADEHVPVVLVERLALDDKGHALFPGDPDEAAHTLRITEYGPERRPLRHRIMVRD